MVAFVIMEVRYGQKTGFKEVLDRQLIYKEREGDTSYLSIKVRHLIR